MASPDSIGIPRIGTSLCGAVANRTYRGRNPDFSAPVGEVSNLAAFGVSH